MPISLRDGHGKELDFASVVDGRDAPAEAMLLLARRARLDPGDLLSSMTTAPAGSRTKRRARR
jgi:hypothetical protein